MTQSYHSPNMSPVELLSTEELHAECKQLRAQQAGQYSLALPTPWKDEQYPECTQKEVARAISIRLAELHDEIQARAWKDIEDEAEDGEQDGY